MLYRKLGRTGLDVSLICLGTMTWGQQNTEAEGHEQMDYAVDQGVNFFDTAELYPVPPKAETVGRTESIIGSWFHQRKNRDKVILATKVVGRTPMNWFRQHKGPQKLSGGDAPVKERFVVGLLLAAPYHQLVLLDRHVQLVACKARHGKRDAKPLGFALCPGKPLDVVGWIAVIGGL